MASEARMSRYTPPPGCPASTTANTPNVSARTSPAEVTVDPVRSSAHLTAYCSGTRSASSLIRVMTRML
jgi:hypothetical protein